MPTDRTCPSRFWPLLVLLVWLAVACMAVGASTARAYTFGPGIQPTGPEQMVFDYTTDRCETDDIPDIPARAFRDSAGKTQLLDTHFVNHRSVGFDLNKVKRDCSSLIQSHGNADPSKYDDMQWIASPYTLDGRNIFALMHTEYRGWTHPGQCDPTWKDAQALNCAYYAIAFSKSIDSGRTYTRRAAPADLVAPSQYRYAYSSGQAGLIQPSNIVYRPDGYFYFLAGAIGYRDQPQGACLFRTRTLADASSWRAWDGSGFTVRFIDPYVETTEPPQAHLCSPIVSTNTLNEQMTTSLTYNTYFGKYMITGARLGNDPQTGAQIQGFWYSLSSDLIHWETKQLLMEGQLLFDYQCGQPDPVQYPSILDPTSVSRNFGVSGQTFYLYYTRMHISYYTGGCYLSGDRDLLRVPIKLSATRDPTSMPDCRRVKPTPSIINDPNNRWALITVRDPQAKETIEIIRVRQDEPTNNIATAARGTTPDEVRVRAQRSATGDGRYYWIEFIATGGNSSCWGTAKVTVPRNGTAVESPASYDAMNPPGA